MTNISSTLSFYLFFTAVKYCHCVRDGENISWPKSDYRVTETQRGVNIRDEMSAGSTWTHKVCYRGHFYYSEQQSEGFNHFWLHCDYKNVLMQHITNVIIFSYQHCVFLQAFFARCFLYFPRGKIELNDISFTILFVLFLHLHTEGTL